MESFTGKQQTSQKNKKNKQFGSIDFYFKYVEIVFNFNVNFEKCLVFQMDWCVCPFSVTFVFGDSFFYLQTECENLGLENFYRTYVQRLQRSYLSMFFVMHTVVAMVHTIILVATQVFFYCIFFSPFSSVRFTRKIKTNGGEGWKTIIYLLTHTFLFKVWQFNLPFIEQRSHLARSLLLFGIHNCRLVDIDIFF